MSDHIVRAVVADGTVRVVAAVTTATAREAARRHNAVGGVAVALARGATAGLLLATLTKGGEQVTLQLLGDGPLGSLVVDAQDDGVRAYVRHPDVLVSAGEGRVRLGDAIGRGILNVVRDLGLKERYSGQVPIATGEVDEDFEHYLTTSEQIASALGCDARVERGDVVAAGGVLVQCLPGAPAETVVEAARARIRSGALVAALAGDAAGDPLAQARAACGDLELEVLDRRPVRFACPCSAARVASALALLGEEELRSMIQEDGRAEVTCNFCHERYELSSAELAEIVQSVRGLTRGRT